MNARELRIGNYLQGASDHVVITRIFNEDNIGIGSGDPYNVSSDMPCLSPIPLTEEWLKRADFIEQKTASGDNTYYYIDLDKWHELSKWQLVSNHTKNKLKLALKIDDVRYWTEKNELIYVHQLQNLYFALTGEELTIKKEITA